MMYFALISNKPLCQFLGYVSVAFNILLLFYKFYLNIYFGQDKKSAFYFVAIMSNKAENILLCASCLHRLVSVSLKSADFLEV